jgi:hypothetical protein
LVNLALFPYSYLPRASLTDTAVGDLAPKLGSCFYMPQAEHHGKYRNCPTRTLDRPSYAGLQVLSLVPALLPDIALIKRIVPPFRNLSIVFCAVPKTYYGIGESQIASLCSTEIGITLAQ